MKDLDESSNSSYSKPSSQTSKSSAANWSPAAHTSPAGTIQQPPNSQQLPQLQEQLEPQEPSAQQDKQEQREQEPVQTHSQQPYSQAPFASQHQHVPSTAEPRGSQKYEHERHTLHSERRDQQRTQQAAAASAAAAAAEYNQRSNTMGGRRFMPDGQSNQTQSWNALLCYLHTANGAHRMTELFLASQDGAQFHDAFSRMPAGCMVVPTAFSLTPPWAILESQKRRRVNPARRGSNVARVSRPAETSGDSFETPANESRSPSDEMSQDSPELDLDREPDNDVDGFADAQSRSENVGYDNAVTESGKRHSVDASYPVRNGNVSNNVYDSRAAAAVKLTGANSAAGYGGRNWSGGSIPSGEDQAGVNKISGLPKGDNFASLNDAPSNPYAGSWRRAKFTAPARASRKGGPSDSSSAEEAETSRSSGISTGSQGRSQVNFVGDAVHSDSADNRRSSDNASSNSYESPSWRAQYRRLSPDPQGVSRLDEASAAAKELDEPTDTKDVVISRSAAAKQPPVKVRGSGVSADIQADASVDLKVKFVSMEPSGVPAPPQSAESAGNRYRDNSSTTSVTTQSSSRTGKASEQSAPTSTGSDLIFISSDSVDMNKRSRSRKQPYHGMVAPFRVTQKSTSSSNSAQVANGTKREGQAAVLVNKQSVGVTATPQAQQAEPMSREGGSAGSKDDSAHT